MDKLSILISLLIIFVPSAVCRKIQRRYQRSHTFFFKGDVAIYQNFVFRGYFCNREHGYINPCFAKL
jgi:hypothetical protein